MRREMIEKKESETMMRVKIHYDGMVSTQYINSVLD